MADDNDIIAHLKVEGVGKFISDIKSSSGAVGEMDKDIQDLYSTLDQAKTKLSGLKEGTKEFNKLSKEIKATEIAMEFLEGGMENAKSKLRQMQQGIVNITLVLKEMEKAGLKGTSQFKLLEQQVKQLTDKAGDLKDTIGDVSETVRNAGSDTRGIDNALRAVTSLSAGFSVVQGASALFGKENEDLQKTLIKLNAVMAITQGLQQIQAEALRNDSIFTLAATKAKQAYNIVVGAGTVAMKAFRFALASLGIGAVIFLISKLVENWDRLKVSIFGATASLDDFRKKQDEIRDANKKSFDDYETELQYLVNIKEITQETADLKLSIKRREKEGSLKDVYDEETKKLKEYKSAIDAVTFAKEDGLTLSEIEQVRSQQKFIPTQKQLIAQTAIARQAELDYKQAINERIKVEEKSISKKGSKSNTTTKDGVGVPIPFVKATNIEELVVDEIERTKKLLALATEEFRNEFFIDPNSESLEPLRARVKDLTRLLEILEAQYKKSLNPTKQTQASILGDFIPELPQDLKADAPIAKKLTLYERIFGTKEQNEARQQEIEQKVQDGLAIVQQLNQIGGEIANIASQAISIRAENELKVLEDKKNKGLISEKEYEKKSAEIKNEANRKQRAIDIATATAKIPLVVLQALSSAPPPFNYILAGIAGTIAAAQVAILAATPLPKFKEGGHVGKRLGLIKGRSHAQGGVPIEVEGNEYVMTTQAVKKYGVNFMEEINNMKFNPIVQSGNKLKMKSDKEYRMNENLATMASYLKQVYKTDAQGNIILTQIRDNIAKNKQVYV